MNSIIPIITCVWMHFSYSDIALKCHIFMHRCILKCTYLSGPFSVCSFCIVLLNNCSIRIKWAEVWGSLLSGARRGAGWLCDKKEIFFKNSLSWFLWWTTKTMFENLHLTEFKKKKKRFYKFRLIMLCYPSTKLHSMECKKWMILRQDIEGKQSC